MSDFLFALNATSPIVIMVAIGYFLKRIGLIDVGVAKVINKLVFRVLQDVNHLCVSSKKLKVNSAHISPPSALIAVLIS